MPTLTIALIATRDSVGEPFRALPTTNASGRLTATVDHGRASRVDIRVSVNDNAGNIPAGELSEISRRVGGHPLRGGAASIACRAPAGPSRQPWLVFAGIPSLVALTRTVHLRGATFSSSGKLVDLQPYHGGRWHTFAAARARGSKGTGASTYRFAGWPGRYSPSVVVRVR